MESSQTYISEKVRNSSNVVINPSTEEGINALAEAIVARLPLTAGGASLIGNSKTKWRFEGRAWGGASDEIWDLIQTGPGMTIGVDGIANGSRYLKISSGTEVGETIIQSKESFRPPFTFAFGLTLSQQIANQETHIELVEVDDNGDVITDTEITSAPFFNDARSGVGLLYDGVTTTSARFKVRSRGISEEVRAAVSHGTGFRLATGTTPNFQPTLQGEISFNSDRVITAGRAINSNASRTEGGRSTNYVPDPEGRYKIRLRVKNLATVTTTDVRLHFGRIIDTTRLSVDFGTIAGSLNGMDAPPVFVVNPTSAMTIAAAGFVPTIVLDVASAAITTSANIAAITPAAGLAYSVAIPVTAVTGTNPTLDIGIEESYDTGTNWRRVYDFERITATGFYTSPILTLQGNRLRYVQTISGTSPNFTRSIARMQRQLTTFAIRQRIDRAINVNSLNATSVAVETSGTENIQISVNMGAITTTAPEFTPQGSDDNLSWYNIGTPIVSVANSTVSTTIKGSPQFIRVIESTAGVGATIGRNGILIKAY